MVDTKGLGLSLRDLYEAGWEIRVDLLPLEEELIEAGKFTRWEGRRPQVLRIARGDQVAVEFEVGKSTYYGDAIAELGEAIAVAKARREADGDG